MSGIDRSITNRIESLEHQKYGLLRLQKMQEISGVEYDTGLGLTWNSAYPSPGALFSCTRATTPQIMLILRTKLGPEYPIEKQYIEAFSKFHLSYRVQVGSVVGLRLSGDIRDDSYVKWIFTYKNGREQIRYGKVEVYL